MAHCERPTYTTPVPPHATTREEKGRRYAVWTDRKGQPVRALILPTGRCRRTVPGRWVGCYRDHRGRKCKTVPFGDRSHALRTAIDLERRAKAVAEGRAEPGRPVGRVRLIDHLPDYLEHLRQRRVSGEHVAAAESTLTRIVAEHGLTTAGRVDAERLAAGLERDRVAGKRSLRTRNTWTEHLKAFGAWMAKTGRADANPFARLPKPSPDRDRTRVRRAATPDELATLVRAARAGGEVLHVSGPDRAALYTLAAYTGLRRGALFALTPESFQWAKGVPVSVFSGATHQKSGHAHGLPVPPAVAREVGAWLRTKTPGEPLFRSPSGSKARTARMLRHDLVVAGIPYRDPAGGVLDFHALRLTFGVMLAKAGVSLVLAQQLLQHSTPVLTANVYSRAGGELAGEAAKLPPLGAALGAKGAKTLPKGRQTANGSGGGKPAKRLKSQGKRGT